MHLKQKYIRTKNNEIIVFPELLQHSEFKHFEPVSAGFISINAKLEKHHREQQWCETSCKCYGESISLGLKSNEEEDTMLANKHILGNYE
jgi:hypothetical protein